MKVVQILPELNEGGVERGVIELTRELNAYNVISYVISGGGILENELVKNGVKHVKYDVYSKNLLTFLPRVFKLRKILKEIAPDIVHVRSRIPAWLIKFAKIGLNFKVVSTVHGLNSPNFYSHIMCNANRIICVSNAVKEHIKRHFNADDSKISVIFRGVDLVNFNPLKLPSKEELRSKYSLKNELVISCVGRITHGKNIETLLKSAVILKQKLGIKILIAGGVHPKKNEYFQRLKALKDELGLSDEVQFLGSVGDVAGVYKLSDVVVSASLKPESFGRSVAEALALNTPVVASNHGGVKDIIKDGENGYFFDPLDADELASKIVLASKLKFNGFDYISSTFTLEKMTKQTYEIYRGLI